MVRCANLLQGLSLVLSIFCASALAQTKPAEGPERIAIEWWRDETGQALTRDYFRLECRDGLRAWLYREGLFGRETAQPRWFLHGLFG